MRLCVLMARRLLYQLLWWSRLSHIHAQLGRQWGESWSCAKDVTSLIVCVRWVVLLPSQTELHKF